MTLHLPFDTSYASLPEQMFAFVAPTPVSKPAFIQFNDALAERLGLDKETLQSPDGLALLSGNQVDGTYPPLAQAYAGHQFGNWNPQLGDGRAVLLGEVVAPDGQRFDMQLKGSGRTPFSRSGDGRAWLGPVLREYIVSEAMHALGIPTTRALAAVTTGDPVYRDAILPGAILTRVASSHIRVGTFQYFAARQDREALQALTDHVTARHYPSAGTVADLLRMIVERQAKLIAKWIGVGFVHGVMNTDNMTVSGETIDFGPCAFLDEYNVAKVFSSIDRQGRYAYGNQPRIAVWNLAQLATALIPLEDNQDAAVEEFTLIINGFGDIYDAERRKIFAAKLGFSAADDATERLSNELLTLMADSEADFTQTFAALSTDASVAPLDRHASYEDWKARWRALRPDETVMQGTNPQLIPRNHLLEQIIQSGVAGDFEPFRNMLAAVTAPFSQLTDATRPFAAIPLREERVTQTFCGT